MYEIPDLSIYDLSNAPLEFEYNGKKIKLDRIRQRHQLSTRTWVRAERIQFYLQCVDRGAQITEEVRAMAIAEIVKDIPKLPALLGDIGSSCHMLAQALIIDGKQATYEEVMGNVDEFDLVRAIWVDMSTPKPKKKPTPSTVGSE